jgi:hypothetical protein
VESDGRSNAADEATTYLLESTDLSGHQERSRGERRQALDRLAQEGEEIGLYEATAGPLPQMRG